MEQKLTPISQLIAEYEKDPAKKVALDKARADLQDRIAREGYDWLVVQDLQPRQRGVPWGVEVKHGGVWFWVAQQQFRLDYAPDHEAGRAGDESLAWMARQLAIALTRLASPCDHQHWRQAEHGRRCTCGELMWDPGD